MSQTRVLLGLGYALGLAVAVADPIPGLFNTGVDDQGNLLPAGAVDPHYRLVQSADAAFPGPNAYVVNDAWPLAPSGPWLAHGPKSKWIAPQTSQASGHPPGNYVYRLTFMLTNLDPETAVITGRWSSDNGGVDILINGVSTGINYDGNFGAFSDTWTIDRGFVEGTNTLEFVVNNAGTSVNPTGFRAELSGTASPPPPPGTPPRITQAPVSATVTLLEPVSFTVRATGSRPLRYQWRHNGQAIPAATNATFSLSSVTAADAGQYVVEVSNDWGSAVSPVVTLTVVFPRPGQPSYEPLGPSSRRTPLVISEIMYHPRDRADGLNLEFIELFNTQPWAEDLSGWQLTGDVNYTFPEGTSIAGLGFLVVAPVPADIEAVYGLEGVLGGFTNRLANEGGTLRLVKRSGAIVLEVSWSDQPPWPVAADGAGHSLVLARPSFGHRDPRAWAHSAFIGGSPGRPDPVPAAPEDNVLINELLAHSVGTELDFVELFNYSTFTVDLSGCWLTDDPATNKFRIPDGTVLGPGGFVAFDETILGFGLSANGETIYLVNSNQTRVIDAVRFSGQAANRSLGRWPDGAPVLSPLSRPTPGAANASPWVAPVIFNEIMFHPISEDSDDEFVELFNRSTEPVNLGGWRLNEGIQFLFPGPTILAPGSYLVVARNAARLQTNYPHLHPGNCLGNYVGSLANGGERITLEQPEQIVVTNALGGVSTQTYFVVVNEVTYLDRSRWWRYADGGGSSLELIDPRADNRLAPNWADSDESTKAPWTTIEFTGTVDNAMPNVPGDQVQLFLLGPGEAWVDDVEVIYAGANRVPNPGFESGVSGWVFQGTHTRSGWETNGGYNSSRCLRLRASDRGEPIGNRIRAPLNTSIPLNATVTLRAKVRWLAGWPEFLMRLRGGGLEAVGRLAVPTSLGTPGAPNSRYKPNAGPAITDVTHRPVLAAANQPIRVSARVQDPDGIGSVQVRYRLDPGSSVSSVPMRDDGTGGDLVAGDGVFTATLPGQAQGALVAFYVTATDAANPPATATFPHDAPGREALVRVGDPFIDGPFGNYRLWMTQTTLNTWATRGNLSNDPLDVTFVYGNWRVIYNAGGMYAGSPAWAPGFNSPVGNLCAYDVVLPGDDLVLGDDKLSLDLPIRDPTNQREQLMHWIADQYGLPNLHRRDVYLFVNGVRRGTIYHDTQQPDQDLLEEWFAQDPDGPLFKTTQWSEGTDAGAPEQILLNSLQRFTSGGVLKVARYRWNWRPRAGNSQLDYAPLLELVEAVNAPTNIYQPTVEALVDVEDWMRMFAMNDLCSYWDAFGNPNAKNTYLYKPRVGRWRLIPWDFDVGLGVFNDPPDAPLFPSNVDPPLQRMYGFPAFVRAYWRELQFGVERLLQTSVVNPLLAAKEAGYKAYGLNFTSPFVPSGPYGLSVPGWIEARRAYLQAQLATVAASFAVTGPTNFSTNVNLVVLTGTAPVQVKTLTVNGQVYPVRWLTVTTWRLEVPLQPGTNVIQLAGLDRAGAVLPESSRTLTITYTGPEPEPEQCVVINEIMYRPFLPGAAYVELFNRCGQTAFDLSGWRLNGLDYTFPPGSILPPAGFLVLAEDRASFAQAYGPAAHVFDVFNGRLDPGGETLTLLRPGSTPGSEQVVDRVRFEPGQPWPAQANGGGSALQLIDPSQDNARVSNWSDGTGWRFCTYTGNTLNYGGSNLVFYFSDTGGADAYVDDVELVAGTQPGVGPNLIVNGDFESGTLSPWIANRIATNSAVVAGQARSGQYCLHLVFEPGGPRVTDFYQPIVPLAVSNVYTLSFWYRPGSRGTNLNARVSTAFRTVVDVSAAARATPGASNSVTQPLPPYPPLWLNEVQPVNRTGPTDSTGQRSPWIELYNAGPSPVSLAGFFLANNYTNLTQWAFPDWALIDPGQFLVVWADGQPDQTMPGELHAGITLPDGPGVVALARSIDGAVQLLDYLNYPELGADWSYGAVPDGQPFYRQTMQSATPGAPNHGAAPPLRLFLNEWMAANTGFLRNPVDGAADDWFELYNPGPVPADLGGCYLTDDLGNPRKFQVPNNGHYIVPPGGYLLVWANGRPEYNRTDRPDLFVNFGLSRNGEALGLFAPDGTIIDAVSFGPQTENVSQGRYPDGAARIYFMALPTPGAANVLAGPPQPPSLGTVCVQADGSVRIPVFTGPGHVYRVEYTDDLANRTWQPLTGELSADGYQMVVTDPSAGTVPQRFYRVILVR